MVLTVYRALISYAFEHRPNLERLYMVTERSEAGLTQSIMKEPEFTGEHLHFSSPLDFIKFKTPKGKAGGP